MNAILLLNCDSFCQSSDSGVLFQIDSIKIVHLLDMIKKVTDKEKTAPVVLIKYIFFFIIVFSAKLVKVLSLKPNITHETKPLNFQMS